MKKICNYLMMTVFALFLTTEPGVATPHQNAELNAHLPGTLTPSVLSDGSPISLNLYDQLRQNFTTAYKWQTNSNVLDTGLRASWSDLMNYLDTGWLKGAVDTGVAFHHVLLESGGVDYFSYAITYATCTLNGTNVLNNPNHNNEMLLLTKTGVQTKNISELAGMKQRYKDSISVYDVYPSGTTYAVKDLSHPNLIYYSGDNFYEFTKVNKPGSTSNYYMHVFNGAVYENAITVNAPTTSTIDLYVQAPVLIMGAEQELYISNDFNQQAPFTQMGMDMGRACPPRCGR